jgi:hypothetical protein
VGISATQPNNTTKQGYLIKYLFQSKLKKTNHLQCIASPASITGIVLCCHMHIPLFITVYQHRTVGHRHASNSFWVIPRYTPIFRCVLEGVFAISRLSAISRLLRVYWRSPLESARLWMLARKAFRMKALRVSPLESARTPRPSRYGIEKQEIPTTIQAAKKNPC